MQASRTSRDSAAHITTRSTTPPNKVNDIDRLISNARVQLESVRSAAKFAVLEARDAQTSIAPDECYRPSEIMGMASDLKEIAARIEKRIETLERMKAELTKDC